MGDVGDYWNEHRAHTRRVRRFWEECPRCAVAYGGNGTLVAPGCKCRNCNWVAPGEVGIDLVNAARLEQDELAEAAAEQKRKARNRAERTCRHCHKTFNTPQGRASHERDVHAKRKATPTNGAI